MWFNKNEMLTSFGLIAFILAIYCIRHIKEGLSNFLRRCSIIVQIGEEATLVHKAQFMISQNNLDGMYLHPWELKSAVIGVNPVFLLVAIIL